MDRRDKTVLALIGAWVVVCLAVYGWTFTDSFARVVGASATMGKHREPST